jgi:hypothetical protein
MAHCGMRLVLANPAWSPQGQTDKNIGLVPPI